MAADLEIITRLLDETGRGTSSVRDNIKSIAGEADKADSRFGALQKSVGTGLKVAAGVGIAAVAAVGVAAVGAGIKAVDAFIPFERQMNEVFTLMPGISQAAMDDMTQQVQDFAVEFGVLPDEAIPALYQALSAGVPPGNVFDFLETAQQAAKGGVTDLETAVDGITSVVNAYGEEIIGATEASDLMFTAVQKGKTTFPELASSLSNVTPLAAATGVEFGNITAALATMTSQGVPTAQATTQLRQLLVELSKSGTQANAAFQDIAGQGFSEFIAQGGNMQTALDILQQGADDAGVGINEMFGSVEAGSAALALSGSNAEAFAENLEAMEGSAGATQAAFDQMMTGLGPVIDRFKAFAQVALLEVAEALQPLLERGADLAEGLLPVLQDALQNKVVPAIETAIGFVDSLAGYFSFLKEEGDPLNDFLANLPGFIQPVVQGIGEFIATLDSGQGVFAAVMEVLDTFLPESTIARIWQIRDAIGEFIGRVQEIVSPIASAVGQFASWRDVLTAVGVILASVLLPIVLSVAGTIAAFVFGTLLPAIAVFGAIVAAVTLVRLAFENLPQIIETVQGAFASIADLDLGALGEAGINAAFEFVGGFLETAASVDWSAVANAITNGIVGALSSVGAIDFLESLGLSDVEGKIGSVVGGITGVIEGFVNTVNGFWQEHGTTIQAVVLTAWEVLQSVISSAVAVIGPAVQAFVDNARAALDSFAPAIEALKGLWESLQPVFSAVTAVIGVVLATLGALVLAAIGIVVGAFQGLAQAIGPAISTFAGVVGLIVNIVSIIVAFVSSSIQVIVAIFQGDFGQVAQIWSSHWQKIGEIAGRMKDNIVQIISGLVGTITGFISGLVSGVIGFFTNLYNTLVGGSIIPDMVNGILGWISTLVGSFTGLVSGLWSTVTGAFRAGWDTVKGLVTAGKDAVMGIVNALKTSFTGTVDGLWSTVKEAFDTGKEAISTAVTNAKESVGETIGNMKEAVTGTVDELWGSVEEAFNTAKETLSTVAGEIASALPEPFREIISDMISVGSDILEGVVTGIENVKGRLRTMLSGVADIIPGWLQTFLGIGSPAKATMFAGEGIMLGIIAGAQNSMGALRDTMADVAGTVIGALGGMETSAAATVDTIMGQLVAIDGAVLGRENQLISAARGLDLAVTGATAGALPGRLNISALSAGLSSAGSGSSSTTIHDERRSIIIEQLILPGVTDGRSLLEELDEMTA